ncbi:hypothetical protein GCM10010149_07380 [Nonomuraea roseoviolacea subsp. roseoviolacea]|uniref:DUF2795 domain-containing protein n=1 Tax=Nonomuraea roseoviolacea subsp. carminata TaxID=160689 RepID=A0ABT1K5W2_9ACTN|nr:DUF2795 domain-containing protein [Nonomuraea roseoviolacea]MCP2349396.1 hypothetical protein [Nonomuraea roseoviolacea subsp. carminata]
MDRGSAKHTRRVDEQQKHETEGMVRGGGPTHAEEWKETEPTPAPGEQDHTRYPPGHEPGTPEGITQEGVEARSDLARWLSDTHFPSAKGELVRHAEEANAPDHIVEMVRSLPDREFENVAQVADALGLGKERRRW